MTAPTAASSTAEKKNADAEAGKKSTDGSNLSEMASSGPMPSSAGADSSAPSLKDKEVDGKTPVSSTGGANKDGAEKDSKQAAVNRERANRERIEREKNKDRGRRPPSPHRPRQQVLTFQHIRVRFWSRWCPKEWGRNVCGIWCIIKGRAREAADA